MKEFFKEVLGFVVKFAAPYRKAVVGTLVGFVVSWLARKGLQVDADAVEALKSGIDGVMVGVLVFLVPNNKAK